MTLTLCAVYSVFNNFEHEGTFYDNVHVTWFMIGRTNSTIPFAEAILNYQDLSDDKKMQTESYIKEQFTQEEARALQQYLNTQADCVTQVDNIVLPVSEHMRSLASFAVGAGKGFITLSQQKGYSLPFKVDGFLNLNLAAKKPVADESATIILKRPKID